MGGEELEELSTGELLLGLPSLVVKTAAVSVFSNTPPPPIATNAIVLATPSNASDVPTIPSTHNMTGGDTALPPRCVSDTANQAMANPSTGAVPEVRHG